MNRFSTAFFSNLSQDPAVAAQGRRTADEFAAYLIPIVRHRRENLGDDLLSTLCVAEVEGTRMSEVDIKSFVSLLIGAGGETTDRAIGSILKNLLEHPDQLAAVRADRGLVEKAFAETLRYSPPVHMIMREAAEDVELSGGVVPAGSTVICLLASANRDPDHFADPDSFDISRHDLPTDTAFSAATRHLAFSLGRHFCVGALLAEGRSGRGGQPTARRDARPGSRARCQAGGRGPVHPGPGHAVRAVRGAGRGKLNGVDALAVRRRGRHRHGRRASLMAESAFPRGGPGSFPTGCFASSGRLCAARAETSPPGGPGESHPGAPTERSVTVSRHSARLIWLFRTHGPISSGRTDWALDRRVQSTTV